MLYAPLAAIALLACDMGPSQDTLVDELRVLVTLAEPPEAAPGEAVALDTLVVDPTGAGFEALTWGCTLAGPDCLEALGDATWDGLTLYEGGADWLSETTQPSAALSAVVSEEPAPLLLRWTLACEPGRCPVIALARSAPAPGSQDADQLRAWLSDPTDFLAELPLQGVSLGLRAVSVSTRAADERLQNPTVDCAPLDGFSASTTADGVVPFDCAVTGDFTGLAGAWGYTTAGGWGGATQPLLPGDDAFTYDWFPDEVGGDAEVWVVVVDGEGGVGLWEGAIDVRP